MKLYDESIMESVRQTYDLEADDTSLDNEIMSLPKDDVLERVLNWEGIYGFAPNILNWVENIYDVKLKEKK